MADGRREAEGGADGLRQLARTASRRRVPILIGTAICVAAAAPAAITILDATRPYEFRDPDSESVRTIDRHEEFTGVAPAPEVAVFVRGPEDAGSARRELAALEGIAKVRAEPLGRRGGTLLLGYLNPRVDDPAEVGERVLAEFPAARGAIPGGSAVASHEINDQTAEDLRRVELVALPVLFLMCLWAFRGVVAAALPLVIGAVSIVIALALLHLIAEAIAIDVFSVNVVIGLGLGLAIDYSLFVVSRFREELARGMDRDAALESSMVAAGRTVAFSAAVVTLALLTMLVFPQRFLYSIAIGGALVAVASALVTLVVLPAALALAGDRVGTLRTRRADADQPGRWARIAAWTMRRPAVLAGLATGVLLLAAVPLSGLELTSADARVLPADRSARQLEERLAAFPAATTEPIVLLAEGTSRGGAERLARRVDVVDGVETTSVREVGAGAFRIDVAHRREPRSPAGQDLLSRIRAIVPAGAATAAGPTAELVDAKKSLRSHLPVALVLLVGTTLVLLAALTRSLVLPAVMVVFNVLSIAAAFGIVTLVFQEGALGFAGEGAIDISIPVLLFAVAFGLSTDYGIFVLARIKEARDGGATESAAVVEGLERSGALVTTAALLFAVAVGGFLNSELTLIREISLGFVAAVLIDATLVRAVLVPATLALLGSRAWAAPRWLAATT